MKRWLLIPVITGMLGGLVVAAFMMYAAWQHNPQEEFHGETGIDWAAWCGIGVFWFIIAGGIVAIIGLAISASSSREPDTSAKS